MKRFLVAMAMGLLVANGAMAKTKIVFWDTSGSEARRAETKQVVDDFNASQSQYEVERITVASSETDDSKLQTAVMAGKGPDVYLLDRFTVAQRAAAGMLEDLSSQVVKDAGSIEAMGDKYVDYAWDEVLFKGHVYGLPTETDIRYLYYNKDMIRAAGVDPAEFDWQNGPLSLSRVKEISAAITKRDKEGKYSEIGFIPWFSQGWHYTWAFAHKGNFVDNQTGLLSLTDSGVVNGIQFMYDWAADYGAQEVATFLSTYSPPQNPEANHPFIQSKIAMLVSGPWEHPKFHKHATVDWGITYIPTPDKSKTSWSGGNSLVVPKGAESIEASYAFIRYFSGPKGMKTFADIAGRFPTLKSLQTGKLPFAEEEFMRDVLANSNSRPALPVGALLWNQLSSIQSNVILNRAEPQAALKKAEKTVNKKLKRYLK